MFFLARLIHKKVKARRRARAHAAQDISDSDVPTLPPYETTGNHNSQNGIHIIGPRNTADEQSTPQPPSPTARSTFWFKVRLMVALLLPVFLETLDYTVVATAQPHIASVFNALSLQSYIGTAYLLSSTVFLPLFASLADVFGRYPGLQISLLFFLIGSAISTGAVNMTMMLLGRGISGIGAAGLLTIVRTILSDSRSLDDNNWQTSILFLLYAIGYAIGPLIGGYLVAISFRWIFAINLPITAASIVLCFFLLQGKVKKAQPSRRLAETHAGKETLPQKLLRIDWIGTFLFVTGGILILLALNWGSVGAWNSTRVIICWILGPLSIIACLLWEYVLERQLLRTTPSRYRVFNCEPMLPLEIFCSYDVCAVLYGSFVSGMIMLVMFYFISIFMTIVAGYSPAQAGVQLVYFAPGMGAGSLVSIRMISRFRQPKYPILLGSMILPISLGLIEWAMGHNNQDQVNGFLVFAGSGVGLTAGSLAIHARFSLPSNRVAVVNAMTLFFRSLGGTVGLAQCSAVLNSKVNEYLKYQVASGSLTGPAADALGSNNANQLVDSLQSMSNLPPAVQTAIRDAYRYGVQWSFISLVPWAGLSFFALLFLSKITDQDRRREEEEARLAREAYQRELMTDHGEVSALRKSDEKARPT
ncbi:MFS general substrate transporter [Gyrodon lividus]|nr:MFS general substrate transporter [Gyrodon lividus]